jgi:hypothetical protein
MGDPNMSTFTRFSADLSVNPDPHASKILGKPYYLVNPGFRYYIGYLGSDKYVDVPNYFLSDGASVPKAIWWLLPPWHPEYGQCAVLHDFLCETFEFTQVVDGVPRQIKIDRAEVDRIFYEAMRVKAVTHWRRNLIQVGVDAYRITTRPKKPKVAQEKLMLEMQYRTCA